MNDGPPSKNCDTSDVTGEENLHFIGFIFAKLSLSSSWAELALLSVLPERKSLNIFLLEDADGLHKIADGLQNKK